MTKKIFISSPILCITSFFAQQFLGNNFFSLASSSNRNLRRPLARFGAAARGASIFHGHQLISVKKSDDGDDADASLSHRRSLCLSLSEFQCDVKSEREKAVGLFLLHSQIKRSSRRRQKRVRRVLFGQVPHQLRGPFTTLCVMIQ